MRPWCPHCGHKENPQWRNSRFVYNADLMRFDEAEQDPDLQQICRFLLDKKNAFPFYALAEGLVYYRRGTARMYLYRVPISDFNIWRRTTHHDRTTVSCHRRNSCSAECPNRNCSRETDQLAVQGAVMIFGVEKYES